MRDYGHDGQIGLEGSPDEYVAAIVEVFAHVRRVLSPTGTLWLNLGDSYAGSGKGPSNRPEQALDGTSPIRRNGQQFSSGQAPTEWMPVPQGLKAKDLVGIPWRVAFALQADGWYLRSDIVWSKPNPMPESVTDRPTKAHEYVFLLSKSARYWFDQDAVREPYTAPLDRWGGTDSTGFERWQSPRGLDRPRNLRPNDAGRNIRSVWEITTQPYADAHFAVFPEELPRRCILAGCPPGGVVLDPFMGSGTTALVARKHGRKSIGIELNEEYGRLAARRLGQQSLLAEGAV